MRTFGIGETSKLLVLSIQTGVRSSSKLNQLASTKPDMPVLISSEFALNGSLGFTFAPGELCVGSSRLRAMNAVVFLGAGGGLKGL